MQGGHLIYNNEKFNAMPIHEGCVNSWDLINNTFELIEDQTIDIDGIKEIETDGFPTNKLVIKINEVIRAVKHLNKEIQSIKK